MFKGKSLSVLVLVCGLMLTSMPSSAAVPGLASIFGRLFGRATVKKAAGRTAGKAIAHSAVKVGVKALPTAGRKISGSTVKNILARSAPKTLLERVTPTQILAVGGATGLVLVGDGVANAMENVASHTAPALAKVIDGTATSSVSVIAASSGVARDLTQTTVLAAAALLALFGILLLWRLGLMPWHRRAPASSAKPATAAGYPEAETDKPVAGTDNHGTVAARQSADQQPSEQPVAVDKGAPAPSRKPEVVDAEIVKD